MSQQPIELKPQHKIFAMEYVRNNFNATKAYKHAYGPDVNDKTCAANGARLLTNANIKALIDKKLTDIADIAEIDAAWSMKKLKDLADRCMQAEPVMEFDKEEKKMVESGEYRLDSAGANGAIDKINKMHGYYAAEKVENSGTINITITSFADLKDLDG